MKTIIRYLTHGLFTIILISLLTLSIWAQHGIQVDNPTGDGFKVDNPTGNGFKVDNPGGSGVVVFDAHYYGGIFYCAFNSIHPVHYASHGNDLLDDLFLGGTKGRIGTDADILVHLDRDNNTPNSHFAVTDGGGTVRMQVNEDGNGFVTGNWNKGGGSFKIDHPLDPANKYLYHSFVESPDMMNVYNDNVILDAQGEATIEMPDWFEALNRDFRYQLTPIGAPGPNLYVAQEMKRNNFRIAGGTPGMKVSWQVTGVRQDPYANENRIKVEVLKESYNQGKYLHPKEWEKSLGVTGLKSVTLEESVHEGFNAEPIEKAVVKEAKNKK